MDTAAWAHVRGGYSLDKPWKCCRRADGRDCVAHCAFARKTSRQGANGGVIAREEARRCETFETQTLRLAG